MRERQPDWDLDFRRGREAEAHLKRVILGEDGTVEVKADDRALDTGNVYVEYECRRGGSWLPSGIQESRADWYAIRVGGVWVLTPRKWLRRAASKAKAAGDTAACIDGSHPTKGALLPLARLIKTLNEQST